jgi:acyl-coenzyme A thioesterase PaaI-like protein
MSALVKKSMSIGQLWERSKSWPMGSRVFSFCIGRYARYSGTIGARVLELEPGFASVEMRDRPAVRNHLKSVHAIALMNLGELCTGLAVMHQVDGRGRGIVKSLSMDYIKKARGTIRGECRSVVPTEPGDYDFVAQGDLLDESGDVVARCTATWRLQIYGVEDGAAAS